MMSRLRVSCLLLVVVAAAALSWSTHNAIACTRAVYFGKESQTVTGRSMDWVEDMHTNLWVFPRGMKRDGGLGKGSLQWTSKYGSVVASVYEGGTADGMNEKGFVANLLYLAESEYPAADDKRPGVCITAWAQYLLDNFATVSGGCRGGEEGCIPRRSRRSAERREGDGPHGHFRPDRRLGHIRVRER